MITVLSGENDILRSEALAGLIDAFVAEHGDMAVERIAGDETTYERMTDAARSIPFLTSRKLLILKSPSLNKEFVENVESFIEGALDMNDIIIVEPKLDKRLAYYKRLKKLNQFRDFPILDEDGLVSFTSRYVGEIEGSISTADIRFLIQRVGTNQAIIKQELDKLVSYDKSITRQTVTLLTEPTPQSSIFELLDAAFSGQTSRAVQLYEEQRAQKVEPQQIIAMLAWQLHVLAIVKAAGNRSADIIAREAKLNPFVVRKTESLAKRIPFSRVKDLISSLRAIDVRMKSQSVIPDEQLKFYLLQLGEIA